MSNSLSFKEQIILCLARGFCVSSDRVKLPARRFDAGAYRPSDDCPAPADFGQLLGVPLVASTVRQGDWIICDFSGAFYTAYVGEALRMLPPLDGDRGNLALNRALRLKRRGGTGCPDTASARRALLLALCAGEGSGAKKRAEDALLNLYLELPPRERMLLLDQSGQLFDALGRLLSFL